MTVYYLAAALLVYEIMIHWIKRQQGERAVRQEELRSKMTGSPPEIEPESWDQPVKDSEEQ